MQVCSGCIAFSYDAEQWSRCEAGGGRCREMRTLLSRHWCFLEISSGYSDWLGLLKKCLKWNKMSGFRMMYVLTYRKKLHKAVWRQV